ncbi:hypothetical protein [Bacillus pinisoli]|uniref:hypothetical protein n=1 Tax=Bacillus pinisoli TaxID=2901866 RepID=UPI001FF1061B|nr:hypothetical protein [Bacillus pinisoli]
MSSFEEALDAVHQAEEAVYQAQASKGVEDRQKSVVSIQVAKEKVHIAKIDERDHAESQHRLHLAEEQLKHLHEAQQALED